MNVIALPTSHDVRPPHDPDAEAAVIGAALISEKIIDPVRVEEGLRAEAFNSRRHQLIWRAIEILADRREGIDTLTVETLLRDRGHTDAAAAVDGLCGAVPSVANARTYARRVIELWRCRRRITAHQEAIAAALDGDETAHAAATTRALDVVTRSHPDPTPQGARQRFAAMMSEPQLTPLPLPWPKLAHRFRMRPGASTIVAAWTSWGKSWLALELAVATGEKDLHAAVWTNEMAEEELAARWVQRATGHSSDDVLDRTAPPGDVATAIRAMPFGIVPCHGWPADEIARDIRHTAPALAVVDHFHALPGVAETGVASHAVQTLLAAAAQAGTHLVIVSQLNHLRDREAKRPDPAMRDLKQTGALQDLPNNVLLLRRKEEADRETGQTWLSDEAALHVAKQRGGRAPLYQNVVISPPRMRIVEAFL